MSDPATVSVMPGLVRARELLDDAKFEQAGKYLIGFLRRYPDHPQALAHLGEAANRLGALGQAEQFYRRAIARGAKDFDTRRQLASVLNQQERPLVAIPLFEALAAERPDPTLRGTLASLWDKTGQNDKAREVFRELAETLEDNPLMWISYGHSLRANGQVEEAVEAYRRAIAIDDGFGDAWWGLASIKRRILTDEDIATMQAALAIAVDERNSAPLNFTLARAFHDRGQYEEAFEHYRAGNAIRAETLKYDATELSAEVDEMIRDVSATFIGSLSTVPVGDDVPIFIISLPRSGSTLLEQMLGSHSQIEAVGELPYIPAILRSFMELATRRGKDHRSGSDPIAFERTGYPVRQGLPCPCGRASHPRDPPVHRQAAAQLEQHPFHQEDTSGRRGSSTYAARRWIAAFRTSPSLSLARMRLRSPWRMSAAATSTTSACSAISTKWRPAWSLTWITAHWSMIPARR